MTTSERETKQVQLKFEPGKLREANLKDLAIRFGFGFGVSVVAALVGKAFGDRIGGVFLAFPAILPASLTLLAKRSGESQALDDVRGAALGTVGLIAFAATATLLFGRLSAVVVLALATVAWFVAAGMAYGIAVITGHGADSPKE